MDLTSRMLMMGASQSGDTGPPGQQLYTNTAQTDYTFVVPAGIFTLKAVCIAPGGNAATYIERSGAKLCQAGGGGDVGDGGGNGGSVNGSDTGTYFFTGSFYVIAGGGGAGGYTGDGGMGLYGLSFSTGSGGGASSGNGNQGASLNVSGRGGGGVGVLGAGASGSTAGQAGSSGTNGSASTTAAGAYGGGSGCASGASPSIVAYRGGNLRWKNDISVTPGESLTVRIGARANTSCGAGAVRIIWGASRAFPSTNTGDV